MAFDNLNDGTSALTIISFRSGTSKRSLEFVRDVGELSGGRVYEMDTTQVGYRMMADKAAKLARSCVIWNEAPSARM